jgi:hypothetical protein
MCRVRTSLAVALAATTSAGCAGPSAPEPPGGGEEYALDFGQFQASVAPVLVDAGCHAGACHGGGIRGTLELSPADALDPAFDFEQVRLQVDPWSPENSPILTKPLANDAGGETHAWEPFASTNDPGYQAILAWILAGEFQ